VTSRAVAPADPELGGLEAHFRRIFDAEPDFVDLSDAARRVLAVAAALFYRQGSAATSVRELARECRLSPGALYNHFASREEMLYVLVEAGHSQVERALQEALAQAGDEPQDQLSHFVRAYTERHLYLPAYAQLVHREYVHLSAPRRAAIVERRRAIREQLVEIIRAGAERQVFVLLPGRDAAVGQAMMIMDMCSRTSEWFNPTKASAELTERYVAGALRLLGDSRN
jgi:TetR/AcrR family transcriptional regulator, cholesterol catabolism regulator